MILKNKRIPFIILYNKVVPTSYESLIVQYRHEISRALYGQILIKYFIFHIGSQ